MKETTRIYLCIDLKCFFASVECVERQLDPFTTPLVVADPSRGRGAICLAVSPKMKSLGVKNRCRIYEIPSTITYQVALPRMNLYMDYASRIYAIYLKYIAKEDIHVYSIDECFLDVTAYLSLYRMGPTALAKTILQDIFDTTGICATVGIGTNLYLAKIALDLLSKQASNHLGWLDEKAYRDQLWHHRPITDFWQVGRGIATRLARLGIADMAGVAHTDPLVLQQEFGINGTYLYDHAWGREPCTIAEIQAYQRQSKSVSSSQILFEDYSYEKALLVLQEMVEQACLDLTSRKLVTPRIALYVGYADEKVRATGGARALGITTQAFSLILPHVIELFHATTKNNQPIRRLGISFLDVQDEKESQYDLFTNSEEAEAEHSIQETLNFIKKKYGKNVILKAMNLEEGATMRRRNRLVGGHNAE